MSLTSLRPEPDLERKGKLKVLMGAMVKVLRHKENGIKYKDNSVGK